MNKQEIADMIYFLNSIEGPVVEISEPHPNNPSKYIKPVLKKDLIKALETIVPEPINDVDPCPLCGSEAKLEHIISQRYNVRSVYQVYCQSSECGCSGPSFASGYINDAEQIARAKRGWNNRI